MGEVYRSRDRLTEEIVALKRALQMPVAFCRISRARHSGQPRTDPLLMAIESPSRSPSLRLRSSREVPIARLALASEFRVLSSLRHPNIVSVLDYGFQSSGLPFFTMKLLTEPMTITRAARRQPLERQARPALPGDAGALVSASPRHHSSRSESRRMCLVTDGHVTVLDFGVSGLPEHEVAGTAGFIAPEILAGKRPTPGERLLCRGRNRLRDTDGRRWSTDARRSSRTPGHATTRRPSGRLGDCANAALARSHRTELQRCKPADRRIWLAPPAAKFRRRLRRIVRAISRPLRWWAASRSWRCSPPHWMTPIARQGKRVAGRRRERRWQVATAGRSAFARAGARHGCTYRPRRRKPGAVFDLS